MITVLKNGCCAIPSGGCGLSRQKYFITAVFCDFSNILNVNFQQYEQNNAVLWIVLQIFHFVTKPIVFLKKCGRIQVKQFYTADKSD